MTAVKGKPYYLRQLIYAVKYDYGNEYLDRSGALINSILKEDIGWSNVGASADGTELCHIQNGIKLSFSKEQFIFSISKTLDGEPLKKPDIETFIDKIKNNYPLIMSEFRISTEYVRRVGSRVIYYIPFDDHKQASEWLINANVFTINKKDLFDGILFSPIFQVTWKGEVYTYALGIDIYERHAQIDFGEGLLGIRASQQSSKQKQLLQEQAKIKHRMHVNPGFFINVDFDFFIEDQEITDDLMLKLPDKSITESEAALKKLFV